MSLQLAAQHLASRGRGPDTQLVHMAPQEVAGLQALAKAAGGTLTVNPDTGLAEAGFLRKLLPTLIGAGLAATGVGAPMAAMLVGGGYGLATGDLRKGLMAGIGAYGGAGLGAGLNAAAGTVGQGATALTAPAEGLASVGGMGMEQAASSALQGNLGSGLAGLDTGISSAAQAAGQATPAGFDVFNATPSNFGAFGEAPLRAAVTPPVDTAFSANYAMGPKSLGVATATPQPSAFSNMKSGLEALGTDKGREAFIGKAASKGVEATGVGGYGGLAKYGLAALSPVLMAEQEQAQYQGSGPNPYNFRFDWESPEGPSYDSREAAQLRGVLRPINRMAAGGPVQEMSDRNAALTLMADGGQMYAEGGETKAEKKGVMGLGSLTHIASPEGTVNFRTGEVTPWSETNPRPTGGGFFGGAPAPRAPEIFMPQIPNEYQGMTGASADAMRYLMGESAVSPATQAARQLAAQPPAPTPISVTPPAPTGGGSITQALRKMRDDPNQPYNFNFDPVTGQMTAAPPAQIPVEETPAYTPDYAANGGLMALAAGGQINLQGTLNIDGGAGGGGGGGQFGSAGTNGYQAVGSGGGLDPRAVAANPQGFQNYMQQMQARESFMPGSTMLAGFGGTAANGYMSPAGGGDIRNLGFYPADMSLAHAMPMGGFGGRGIGFAAGGVSHLGDYSDGGRLLKGPGDGVSDSIPATIADKRPARLADGEFVVPARIVSELGNGSTEAGARKLYAMMDRVQNARKKSIGKKKVAVNSRADKALPA